MSCFILTDAMLSGLCIKFPTAYACASFDEVTRMCFLLPMHVFSLIKYHIYASVACFQLAYNMLPSL